MTIDKNSKFGLFLSHVLPGVTRPLRVLWHEVIGFVFACFFAGAAFSTFRNLRDLNNGQGELMRVLVPGLGAALMGYFGVTSFLRARKISRS